ncbi:acyl-phosphate glycerol 3-phosphate acyltransferase [Wolbachia pipientis]|uniref:Acyl-phosphate glycerol 3-phosphate acyltransferase n=1 Tax=Wolbachia pipientis TaxID=955 RepID=A0A1E7QK93_WOLPI|nr:lysophospholipid acyltransferase family protein [Wolbachia pipientis]OEY86900.1 acyl-phosphate glycerol 3-phosphate acyltransferase [Wolbachia pipientis]
MVLNILFNFFLVIWEVLYTLIGLPIILFPPWIITLCLVYAIKITLFMLSLLCGVKYEVKGLGNIPQQPCIIASKHQSPLETFIFIILFRGAAFVLKREIKLIPFIGCHLMALKMIFIDRSDGIGSVRNIIKLAQTCIKGNRNIIIFPEGTRAAIKQGQHGKYQSGVVALYSALSVPVVPVALNTGLFWPKNILSLRRKPGKAIIEILPPIYPGLDKKTFLVTLEKTIEERSSRLALKS